MGIKTEWFASWFDSPYYHILYQHRDHEEAAEFIKNLLEHLSPQPGSKALDLACGKGRHSFELHKKGLIVTGLDLSPKSIKEAEIYREKGLDFAVHDMREVYKENAFDFVFNLFTSFGYFDQESDNLRVLKSIKTMLKPGGTFVIDYLNTERAIQKLVPDQALRLDGIDFHISRSHSNGFILKDIRFQDQGKSFHFQEKVKAINLDQFREYFREAGMEIIHTFGDFSLSPFIAGESERLIIQAVNKQ